MEYYSFIAGLPDIQPDDAKSLISLSALKEDIAENLSAGDFKLLNLFFYSFDNANLCALLLEQDKEWSALGTLSREEMEDFISYAKEGKIHQDEHLPPYFAEFVSAFHSDSPLFPDMTWADQLTSLYYLHAIGSSNQFISQYFEFNLNLQNVLSALIARKHSIDVSQVVIGDGEIAENIRSNTSKDFGIGAMFPYLEDALRIDESKKPLEREQKIDALRWQWLEDNTVFHYFSKERIFSYILKLEMLERWLKMDIDTGKNVFEQYVKELVSSVKIEITQ